MKDNNKTNKKQIRKVRRISNRAKRFFTFLFILLMSIAYLVITYMNYSLRVVEHVFIEASEEIRIEDFLIDQDDVVISSFISPVSEVDTSIPATYTLAIRVGRQEFTSLLTIEDTVAPDANAISHEIRSYETLEPVDFVADITDANPELVNIEFVQTPDFTIEGQHDVQILLTDQSYNQTIIDSSVNVLVDHIPPVISGLQDIEAYIGDTVYYRNGVTVSDNWDEDVELVIDTSNVNPYEEGTYEVFYTAIDNYDNQTTASIELSLEVKPDGLELLPEVEAMAQEIIDEIITDDMSDIEKAFEIYKWVIRNIHYSNQPHIESWVIGAYDGLSTHTGDCFTYFAVSKALFEAVGIENLQIEKQNTSYSRHYWNLILIDGAWYHFDTTPRANVSDDNFFMVTNDEILAYSNRHYGSHLYDPTLFEDINFATESIQDQVNYYSLTLELE